MHETSQEDRAAIPPWQRRSEVTGSIDFKLKGIAKQRGNTGTRFLDRLMKVSRSLVNGDCLHRKL